MISKKQSKLIKSLFQLMPVFYYPGPISLLITKFPMNYLQMPRPLFIQQQYSPKFRDLRMTSYRKSIRSKIQFEKKLRSQTLEAQRKDSATLNTSLRNQGAGNQGEGIQPPLLISSLSPKKEPSKRKKRVRRRFTRGFWSVEENAKYYLFMVDHKQEFRPNVNRRRERLFIEMSKFVVSRNPIQCRIHHQKQEAKQRSYEQFFVDLYNAVKMHPLIQKIQIQNLPMEQSSKDQPHINFKAPSQQPIIFTYQPDESCLPIDENSYLRLYPNNIFQD